MRTLRRHLLISLMVSQPPDQLARLAADVRDRLSRFMLRLAPLTVPRWLVLDARCYRWVGVRDQADTGGTMIDDGIVVKLTRKGQQ
jgi:hypothetical protein